MLCLVFFVFPRVLSRSLCLFYPEIYVSIYLSIPPRCRNSYIAHNRVADAQHATASAADQLKLSITVGCILSRCAFDSLTQRCDV